MEDKEKQLHKGTARRWSLAEFVEEVANNYLFFGLLTYEDEARLTSSEALAGVSGLLIIEFFEDTYYIQVLWNWSFFIGGGDIDGGAV